MKNFLLTFFLLLSISIKNDAQVIAEFQYNTAGTDEEWIEFCNPTSIDIDISGYKILINTTEEFIFPASATLLADACIIVLMGDDGDGDLNTDCPFTPDYELVAIGSGMTNTLPNTTGANSATITLTDANDVIIDEVTYDDSHESQTAGTGKTFTLIDLSLDNAITNNGNWVPSLDVGGSPKVPNNVNCPSAPTEVQFITIAGNAREDAGVIMQICVNIQRPSTSNPTTVEVALTGGTATNGTDIIMYDSPQILTFPAGSFGLQCIEITIEEDTNIEGSETLQFTLQNPTGGDNHATIGTNATYEFTIRDNDYAQVILNEISFNPLGNSSGDMGQEFFEIKGTPNANLDGIWLLAIEGEGTSKGTIEKKINLNGQTLGNNGLFLGRDAATDLAPAPDANTNSAVFSLGFENGTTSYLLVTDYNEFVNDIDDNDDGIIDLFPWDSVLDAVAFSDDNGTDGEVTYVGDYNGPVFNLYNGEEAEALFRDLGEEWIAVTTQAGPNNEYEFVVAWYSDDTGIEPFNLIPPILTPGNENQSQEIVPIEWLDFQGFRNGKVVDLFWRTAIEKDNAHFVIERSNNAVNYEKIGIVKGIGDSSNTQAYSFKDLSPLEENSYYRLRQVDISGTENFSTTLFIATAKANLIEVYPNLLQHTLWININETLNPYEVKIFNLQGELTLEEKVKNKKSIEVSHLPKGLYFLCLFNQSGNRILHKKLVKQ